jgi:hypothetical protein
MTPQEQIKFFFAPPLPPQSGRVSPLHLLRREAQLCLIGDVIPEDHVMSDHRRDRLFATSLVIMAGIDLLAKCYRGDDNDRQVADRFTTFAEDFIFTGQASASEFADVLYYGWRNPLVHSFTMHSRKLMIAVVLGFPGSGVVTRIVGEPAGYAMNC